VCFLPCQGQIYKTIIVLNSMQQKKKLKRLRISNKQAESINEKLKLNNYLGINIKLILFHLKIREAFN